MNSQFNEDVEPSDSSTISIEFSTCKGFFGAGVDKTLATLPFFAFSSKAVNLPKFTDVFSIFTSRGFHVTYAENITSTYATELHLRAQEEAEYSSGNKKKSVIKHWEAALYDIEVFERWFLQIKYSPQVKA